ncbi:4-alpha-glucanotransferase [Paratractidigestivibacter sp.]|uniref:4-alpha-glucanotransferase n=1 Tax=Paratractidigestivibacter sp. TaxID=2847316 RepID=UPI002ABE2DD0|nr:4-alpha-glucanotransferase [Paratractidigestivibacter sp.]
MGRTSGVLLPVSALPGPGGIGGFGESAYRFVDFLNTCKQRYWQILPLTTTSYGDSPYQSFSARAGNPNLIDIAELMSDGYLTPSDLDGIDLGNDPSCIDYGRIFISRRHILDIAATRFAKNPPADYAEFLEKNASWLDPYCEFMTTKEEYGLKAFWEWPEEARRPGAASRAIAADHPERMTYHHMTQYFFARQWARLKAYANKHDILIIGDMPIYVSRDSVEMWANPELFKVGDDGTPLSVAGTPPDNFSATGQYWGNPIYNWDAMAADGYSWWEGRMRDALAMYDVVRLDHFRGFEAYWEVPFGSPDSSYGSWTKGPGLAFFQKLKEDLGDLPLIAEDLGFLTPEVIAMRDGSGFPGMKILQFAFDGGSNSYYLPHNYSRNTIAYVGTHDNETARGWFEGTATARVREQALDYLRPSEGETIADALNRAIAASVSDTCIYSMQDLLNLGNEARTNTPSTVGANWRWRMEEGAITRALERRLTGLTETYFRVPGESEIVLPD